MSLSILFVHQGYELYGSDRTMLQSVRAAKLRWPNAKLTVLLPREGPLSQAMRQFVKDVRITELAVLRKSNLKKVRPSSLVRLAQRVSRARKLILSYDLVYINTVPVLDYILAAGLTKHRAIVHVHELPSGATAKVLAALVRFSGASIIFNSNATAVAFPLGPEQRGEVIWNGIADNASVHAESPHDELRILMIGRFNAWKGQAVLLNAIGMLSSQDRSRIRVRMIGSYFEAQRHFYDDLVRTVRENALEDIVEILPFREDPSYLYAWADIVAVPSIAPEPFGLVAIEAMAAGCCVVAANHGGLPEIVIDGSTGTLVKPGSVEDLATAITTYLRNPGLVQQHGAAGRMRFLQEFHESLYMERIANFIEGGIKRS